MRTRPPAGCRHDAAGTGDDVDDGHLARRFDLLYRDRLNLNIGILILVALACGMYRHHNTSRQWCIGLTWFSGVAVVLMTVTSPFISGESITIAGKEFPDPPIWRLILTDLALLPAFWVVIPALTSCKAREEFGFTEQSHAEATSETTPITDSDASDA